MRPQLDATATAGCSLGDLSRLLYLFTKHCPNMRATHLRAKSYKALMIGFEQVQMSEFDAMKMLFEWKRRRGFAKSIHQVCIRLPGFCYVRTLSYRLTRYALGSLVLWLQPCSNGQAEIRLG